MLKLEIEKFVGQRCITQDDGRKVFEEIYSKIKKGESVQLDFSSVTAFASPFFNHAIGQLMRDFSVEELNKLVSVNGLEPDGMIVWRRVVRNARAYYTNPKRREVIDNIAQKFSEGQDL